MECSRVEMLKKIQCSNFAAYDMLLYLDTHSDDKKAFRMFQALVKKTKELKCEYEEKLAPQNQFLQPPCRMSLTGLIIRGRGKRRLISNV